MPGKRPFQADDLAQLRVPNDVQLSPTDRRALWVTSRIDLDQNRAHQELWLADLRTGEARPLTTGSKRENHPRWSPDGRWVAFLSDRSSERTQVYVLPIDGGDAQRVTELRHGVTDFAWAPSSDRLVCVARVRDGESGREPGEAPSGPPLLWHVTRLRSKADGQGQLSGRTHLFVVDIVARDARQLTRGDWDDAQPAWSPDGQTIAFVSDRSRQRDIRQRLDIWTVPVAGGRPRRVTRGTGSFAAPSWSPDGTQLAYLGHGRGNDIASSTRLWVCSDAGQDHRCLTADYDRSLSDDVLGDLREVGQTAPPVWASDQCSIATLVGDRGRTGVVRVSLTAGEVTPLVSGDRQVTSFDASSTDLVVAFSSPTEPGEVAVIDPAAGTETRLSHLNDEVISEIELSCPTLSRFAGARGDSLDGWVIEPSGTHPGPWPTILEIHGGPHSLYGYTFMAEFQVLAGSGCRVGYTNPHGSQGYGETFAGAIRGDWGGADYEDVLAFTDHLVQHHDADPTRMGVIGGSYGGYLTNWIVGHTDRFQAAITDRSVVNMETMFGTSDIGVRFCEWEFLDQPIHQPELYRERSPLAYAERVTTPVLIIHGEQDLRCPIEQAEQWFTRLKRAGCQVEMLRFPEESHNLSRSGRPDRRIERLKRIVGWFERWLGPGAER